MSKKLPAIIELSAAQLAEARGGAARPALTDRLDVVELGLDPISPFARRGAPTEFSIPTVLATVTLPDLKPALEALRAGALNRTQ